MRVHAAVVMCGLAALLAAGCGGPLEPTNEAQLDGAVTSHSAVQISWEEDWDRAFERARGEGKPVLANFYAEWCVWCKHMDTVTFRDTKVAALLEDRVVSVGVDIDDTDRSVLEEHSIEAPPTIVVFDADGTELGRIPGYLPPTGFLRSVEGILSKFAPQSG
jgi:thiol:disulfide interchange protein